MYLSVIVPVYNEEKTLDKNIQSFNNYLVKQDYDFEIIIVNDGSKDGSGGIANKLARENSKIRVIDNKINKGKGFVVRQGIVEGKGDFRLFIDADNATTIDHLDLAWEKFSKGADLVIGTRSTKDVLGTKQIIKQAKWKVTFGILGNSLIQFLLVRGIWDTQCGFKIFKKEIIEDTVAKTKTNRWAIDVEMLLLAQKNNFKIAKIPVSWKNSEFSRVGVKGYLVALKEVLQIKKNLFLNKYN